MIRRYYQAWKMLRERTGRGRLDCLKGAWLYLRFQRVADDIVKRETPKDNFQGDQ